MSKKHRSAKKANERELQQIKSEQSKRGDDMEPDWGGKCEVCGASPIVPATGMCGPCTFGEADTVAGNW